MDPLPACCRRNPQSAEILSGIVEGVYDPETTIVRDKRVKVSSADKNQGQPTDMTKNNELPKAKIPRLVSLDTFRGIIMCTLAANGFAFAETAKKLGYLDVEPESWAARIWQWLAFHGSHTFWNSQCYVIGCSYWDLIQPAFMLMVGVAIPYSFASRRTRGDSTAQIYLHAAWRALVLVLLGIVIQCGNQGLEYYNVLGNVLAQIGLGYFIACLLIGIRARYQIGIGVCILVGYWVFMVSLPIHETTAEQIVSQEVDTSELVHPQWYSPENVDARIRKSKDELLSVSMNVARQFTRHTNVPESMDRWLLNQIPRKNRFLLNPEGFATLNFIPSLVTMVMGLIAGQLLRSSSTEKQKVAYLMAGGAICMTIAMIAGFTVCPMIKRIWTPSWTLYSGAWVLWMLAALYWVIDIRGIKFWTWPLVVVGTNSLAIYLMHFLLFRWTADRIQVYFGEFSGSYSPTIEACAVFSVFWLVCLYLYSNKIFLRV